VYRDKCVDVSKVRCRVQQFKQEERGKQACVTKQGLDRIQIPLNAGKNILKLVDIMWKTDYAQL
jgi:hypothetical protein